MNDLDTRDYFYLGGEAGERDEEELHLAFKSFLTNRRLKVHSASIYTIKVLKISPL